jgi:hypothetical protein
MLLPSTGLLGRTGSAAGGIEKVRLRVAWELPGVDGSVAISIFIGGKGYVPGIYPGGGANVYGCYVLLPCSIWEDAKRITSG